MCCSSSSFSLNLLWVPSRSESDLIWTGSERMCTRKLISSENRCTLQHVNLLVLLINLYWISVIVALHGKSKKKKKLKCVRSVYAYIVSVAFDCVGFFIYHFYITDNLMLAVLSLLGEWVNLGEMMKTPTRVTQPG